MTGKVNIGEQICLRPTPQQIEIIYEACKLCGYPQNGEGVLALLMDQLLADKDEDGEEDETPLSKIVQFYRDNPGELQKLTSIGKAIFRGLKR